MSEESDRVHELDKEIELVKESMGQPTARDMTDVKYCPFCGNEVAIGASTCPHCGRPQGIQQTRQTSRFDPVICLVLCCCLSPCAGLLYFFLTDGGNSET